MCITNHKMCIYRSIAPEITSNTTPVNGRITLVAYPMLKYCMSLDISCFNNIFRFPGIFLILDVKLSLLIANIDVKNQRIKRLWKDRRRSCGTNQCRGTIIKCNKTNIQDSYWRALSIGGSCAVLANSKRDDMSWFTLYSVSYL